MLNVIRVSNLIPLGEKQQRTLKLRINKAKKQKKCYERKKRVWYQDVANDTDNTVLLKMGTFLQFFYLTKEKVKKIDGSNNRINSK